LRLLFLLRTGRAPRATLFPYTTLFRSCRHRSGVSATIGCAISAGYFITGDGQPIARAFTKFDDITAVHHTRTFVGDGQREADRRSEEHTSELQSREKLVCRLLLATETQ